MPDAPDERAGVSGTGERIGYYRIADDSLPAGSTLGAPKICMVVKPTGAIEKIYSIDAGAVVIGSLTLHHWDDIAGVRLSPLGGTFVIRPEVQEHELTLPNAVQITERLFVLNGAAHDEPLDPPAAYYRVDLRNDGEETAHFSTYAFCRLRGEMQHDVTVEYDRRLRAFAVCNESDPEHVRFFSVSDEPDGFEATTDHGKAVAGMSPGALAGHTRTAAGDPLGVFHHRHVLEPKAVKTIWYTLTFSSHGRRAAEETLRSCPDVTTALKRTAKRYERLLARSTVVTPDAAVNRGVLWAKANMLRTQLCAPTGWCFTNDPTRSNNSVGRDTAWFSYGADYLTPAFSREALLAYVKRQERSGMIVEYYDIRTGKTADYGLNVNDNTPLLVLALWHHYHTTGDEEFLRHVYPAALKAGRFLLSQRDERGLVWCTSTKTQDWGIVGWRNVIENYRLSGATTELNSECYAALQTVGRMGRVLGKHEESAEFGTHASQLRDAINTHLANPDNGLYYLNIDIDGNRRTDVTCDLVFPVMFGVADDERAARIISRLSADDFWTDAGIRTIPRDAPDYGPTHGYGLLGGVWVGVTFWYAFAAARFDAGFMAYALSTSFNHYSRDPGRNNTVPGQFSEWLHGETLTNEGMMLSPWFPPRYLWAAIEGMAGFDLSGDTPAFSPRLAPEWKWLGVRDLPFRGKHLTWFAARIPELRTYVNTRVHESEPCVSYEEDISPTVQTEGRATVALGLRQGSDLALFAGNTLGRTVATAIRTTDELGGTYTMRIFNSMRSAWTDGGTISAEQLRRGIPLELESKGFALLELHQTT